MTETDTTNLISQRFSDSAVMFAISVSKRCPLNLSVVKARGSRLDIFVSPTILENLSLHVLTFSIKFLSSSAFLGFDHFEKLWNRTLRSLAY